MLLKTSPAGVALIKEFEGLRLEAYQCSADKCTIGYGHTRTARPGMKITAAEAERLLAEDLQEAEAIVDRLITMPLNENQHAALVSFAYNFGPEKLRTSTLRRLINGGRHDAAAGEFAKWDNVRDKRTGQLREERGLVRRRAAEANLFRTPVDSAPVAVAASEAPSENATAADS